MAEFKQDDTEKQARKEDLYAKVLDLKDLISYQQGTVASRMSDRPFVPPPR